MQAIHPGTRRRSYHGPDDSPPLAASGLLPRREAGRGDRGPAAVKHNHPTPTDPSPMADAAPTDPWFQTLFADRLGGASYGKGTEIYKFEKIKRAKRQALAD